MTDEWIEELLTALEGVEYAYSAAADTLRRVTPGHRIARRFSGDWSN